ncbi:MAG: hypothetical protein AAGC67_02455 [Myxococcota bacterium]
MNGSIVDVVSMHGYMKSLRARFAGNDSLRFASRSPLDVFEFR